MTAPLVTITDLGVTLAAGVLLFAAIEVEKWILRRRKEPVVVETVAAGRERLA